MHRLPPTKQILCTGVQCSKPPRLTVGHYELPLRQYFTGLSTKNINHEATNVAILGGGITGLASAHFLSRSLPNATITIVEASSRLGGWLHSRKVDVGNGSVVFEQGPRNLRPTVPNGLITLDLVRDLGLEERLLMTSKDSFAAQNRFIYYPDHLVRMPGPGASLVANLYSLFSEGVFNDLFLSIVRDYTEPVRPADLQDESIGSFLSRRFSSTLADNIPSAIFHGIYAGDIYKLSARSILSGAWQLEKRHKSVVKGLVSQALKNIQPVTTDDLDVIREYQRQPPTSDILEAAKKSSVFTFKGGIGELAAHLEAKLRENPMVSIEKKSLVKDLTFKTDTEASTVEVTTFSYSEKENRLRNYSHVISTIAGDKLALIAGNKSTGDLWPSLGQTDAVTVMVVNLFFSDSRILPVHGFGYLIPRSIALEQNPERALGVVFDSDASLGQDDASGTKITVMLGGHWWDGFESYPTEAEGASMAIAVLKRHLGISELPVAFRVSLQHDCIPQYSVGHDDRMAAASHVLEGWDGRLRVAGNSYTGVGLNDCVRAARDVVKGLVDGTKRTGLESFVGGKKWSWVKPSELKLQ